MKTLGMLISIIMLLLVAGCAGTMPGPGQPFPGSLVASSTIPAGMTIGQEYMANPGNFEVLGLTEGSASNSSILGIFSFGNGGYIKATDNAMDKVGADGLINCVADIKSSSFLFLFSSSKTIVRGLAIKRK